MAVPYSSSSPPPDAPQEDFIRALLNNLSEAIVACDAEGYLMEYNAAARRLLNLPPVPPVQCRWDQYCTLYGSGSLSEDRHPLALQEDPLWRAHQGESVLDFELDLQPHHGPRCTVLVNGDPIRNAEGEILGAVVTLRDITALRRATNTLREREALLRSIYNGLKASIFVVDVEEGADGETFRYVSINPAHEALTGLKAKQIRGKTPTEILPPPLAATVIARYRACVAARAPFGYEENLPFQGHEEWWLTTLTPLIDAQDRVHRLIGTSLNITRRYQAEARVQQLNADLEQRVAARTQELTHLNAVLLHTTALLEKRNHELDQFVYVASHDLKAPLRAIANLSSWLEEDLTGTLPEENQDQLRLLRGRVHRMEALINGLLEYSRAGRRQVTLARISSGTLVAEVIDSLAPPKTFTLVVPPDMPVLVTKVLPLQQVFANLISNAIKYVNRPDGHIAIAWADQGDAYRFSVADNGPGIESSYHEKIFAVFQTLQARDQIESTGIGLAIVKKVVEAEGGRVTVESTVGSGTTFHFTWPKVIPLTDPNSD
ncbi:PAS domain-containing protein [Leptolyngbya sp. PCC 6406]|uniref:PAS domain-containing protein n=1 Tax=Leptolyngbya sp. PCC 6406 TaxID=1173264 RepID=UPI0002ACBC07|nr:PAS domain-containing protein [Leptolyngbya sp. PCC 6406]